MLRQALGTKVESLSFTCFQNRVPLGSTGGLDQAGAMRVAGWRFAQMA